MKTIRVRFAPSPTGALHIGGVRTALFNYLFARKHKGSFILRIEDTDQSRFVQGAEEYIKNTLEWLGLEPDESPFANGPFAPYRQSERKEIYKSYIDQLLESGLAYYAFDTAEELEQMRENLKEQGAINLNYNAESRLNMSNSLTLSAEEVQEKIAAGSPYVIRVKIPENETVLFKDIIRGDIAVDTTTLDDKVLMKSDGLPTYHLANVVDDHLMEISHVIRGEEWLPSAPLHYLLYKFLGWESSMPQFAHLPLILKPDGKGKLSKRAADKAGIPIFPLNWEDPASGELNIGFKESGYLREALINFLALLGWNPGTEDELFEIKELIEAFSLERIGKSGTKFDLEKAKWFNQEFLNKKSTEELRQGFLGALESSHQVTCDQEMADQIIELLKSRVTFAHEMVDEALIFFQPPSHYDEKTVRKKWNDEASNALMKYIESPPDEPFNSAESAKSHYWQIMEAAGINPGSKMQALRLTLTGHGSGPDLMEIIRILGWEKVVDRIKYSIDALNSLKTES